MNEHDALKLMVRKLPGGIEVVALRLGKAVSTLEKELDAAPGFKLGVSTAAAITDMCREINSPHTHAYVNAIAARAGVAISLRPAAQARPVDVMRDSCEVLKEVSDVVGAATNAAADRVPTANDVRAVEREAAEAIAAIQHLVADVRTRHAEGVPSYLREVGGK